MGRFELQVLYARAMTKLWEKIEAHARLDDLRIADFGTRRRHSFLWQDWCVQAMGEGLGEKFVGTSNCLIAKNRDLEAIGTNAHELPMVYSALAEDDADLGAAPYDVLRTGRRSMTATCASSCPIPTGPKVFAERPGLAGGLDWHPHRQRRSGYRRRNGDQLVESAGRRSARQAGDLSRTGWMRQRLSSCIVSFRAA